MAVEIGQHRQGDLRPQEVVDHHVAERSRGLERGGELGDLVADVRIDRALQARHPAKGGSARPLTPASIANSPPANGWWTSSLAGRRRVAVVT